MRKKEILQQEYDQQLKIFIAVGKEVESLMKVLEEKRQSNNSDEVLSSDPLVDIRSEGNRSQEDGEQARVEQEDASKLQDVEEQAIGEQRKKVEAMKHFVEDLNKWTCEQYGMGAKREVDVSKVGRVGQQSNKFELDERSCKQTDKKTQQNVVVKLTKDINTTRQDTESLQINL